MSIKLYPFQKDFINSNMFKLAQDIINFPGCSLIWDDPKIDKSDKHIEKLLKNDVNNKIIAPGDGTTRFLGPEPYLPSMEAIYAGLGIPFMENIEVIDIKSAIRAKANKELSQEILDELDQEEPIDPEQAIASAKEKLNEQKTKDEKVAKDEAT